jgi:HSP20 family molecular chaperone IbpA
MSRSSLFNSPLLLGFDQLERALDRMNKHAGEGYPPYNVEQLSESHLRITLAVAGFSDDDLQIQVENSQLVIRGRQEEQPERIFLHRGIAARQFQRSFMLADGIEITGARLDNGLLHIDLQRPIEQPNIRTIKIDKSGRPAATIMADDGGENA